MSIGGIRAINSMTMLDEITSFEVLYKAYTQARKCKRWKREVAYFELHLEENLIEIQNELINKTYQVGKYHEFIIHEPKERLIMANSFKDKVVQHALCDVILYKYLTPTFIYDNYASQKGKGTDFARNRLKHHLHSYYRKYGNGGYILKCDIKKYFYNIDHDILKSVLQPHFDNSIWWLIERIIDSTDGKGLPIGNQSSQYFSVIYLSKLDHFIKEKLHIKYYGRYVDDLFLIHQDKDHLIRCLKEIKKVLPKVELNNKTQIFKIKNGIEFLGFKFYLTKSGKVILKLAKGKKQRLRRRFKKIKNEPFYKQSYECSINHISKGNTYYLRQKLKE